MGDCRLQTGFLSASHGSIHLSIFLPKEGFPSRWVLHFPAFAEEMNKSRAVVARTARALASNGMAVIVPDLYGTGDSDGDFVDARWTHWLADQLAIVDWAREQGADEWVFWGLRAGCLLAAEAAVTSNLPPAQLVYWQPVHSGKQLMRQFLRLRVAAAFVREGKAGVSQERDSIATLTDELLSNGSLQVAGYQLGTELFQAFSARVLDGFQVPQQTALTVLEIAGTAKGGVSHVTREQLERWRQRGVQCTYSSVQGDAFWSTQELGEAPALMNEMAGLLGCGNMPTENASHPGWKTALELSGLSVSSSRGVVSVIFPCIGSRLIGMLHQSCDQGTPSETAIVIVVGGPQYRIGSHRQFVLLARTVAEAGYNVLRFDYRGMGDSEGALPGFNRLDEDIRCAIDALQNLSPSVTQVVLWGLCDAATASVIYAANDQRVHGLVLANPWVYSEQGAAKAYLKHYYLQRLLTRSFWSKLISGGLRPRQSLASIAGFISAVRKKRVGNQQLIDLAHDERLPQPDNLVELFAEGLSRFSGSTLVVLSGKDLTAAEFSDAGRSSVLLSKALASPLVHRVELPGVDHTFSRPSWRRSVEKATVSFIRTL